ncbi:MAG: type I DNA topoisomerase [Candidatus Eisenbacteria sp.]|nr:type I DNA topoisomerase [Candidatus Eisenbacteria bacterium]
MAKPLIIVESPAKARTISRLAGRGYNVVASNGHVRDLPKSKLGVDPEKDFEPHYVTIRTKSAVIKQMREKAKNSAEILLAPDPDREGEAIAWHLTKVLSGDSKRFKRLVFHEITQPAIRQALASPHEIDMNKVSAQQARRILDRLVGYQLSPVLWKTIRYGLSAGRVQSVALRLIVDREREVEAFVAVEYWSIHAAALTSEGQALRMGLVSWEGKRPEIHTAEEAQQIIDRIKDKPLEVTSLKTRRRKRNASAPFITSTLQQDAFRALRFSSKKTMKIAQELYEGLSVGDEGTVGLITYMRTDSTRVANEALNAVRAFVDERFGHAYLPDKPIVYKKKGRTQDAHEAIRPTAVSRTPETMERYLNQDQRKLYGLIWRRFVASQMCPQELEISTVEASCAPAVFRASGKRVAFDGFTRLYEAKEPKARREQQPKEAGQDAANGRLAEGEAAVEVLPKVHEGEQLQVKEYSPKQHFTEPPTRYSEASLIKALEENGIGRPSTYATIVSTILTRDYVNRDKGRLVPTDLGGTVVDLLVRNFPKVMNVDFTAHMEQELDRVEEGRDGWVAVVREFYEPFKESLQAVAGKVEELKRAVQVPTGQVCEKCEAPMVRKFGRNGPFLACSRYPDCKHTQPLRDDEKPQLTSHTCPKCGSPLMLRTGRFGRFLACSNYPQCKTTRPVPVGVACPEEGCEGQLVEKRTRNGRAFFGCDQYPKCKYAVWDRPFPQRCPECGHPFMLMRETKRAGAHYACPRCKATCQREGEREPRCEESA